MKTNHTPQALKEVVEFVEEIIFTITSAQNTYKYQSLQNCFSLCSLLLSSFMEIYKPIGVYCLITE